MISNVGQNSNLKVYQAAPSITSTFNKLESNNTSINSDTVSLSAQAYRAASSQRTIFIDDVRSVGGKFRPPQEYPEGFPEYACEELEHMAKDPSISNQEYSDLCVITMLLPQCTQNLLNGYSTPDKSIFMNEDFSLKKNIQEILDADKKYGGGIPDRLRELLYHFA